MKVGLDKTVITIYFLYRHSAVTESLLASYTIAFLLTAISSILLPNKTIANFMFILPSTYLFLITRIDQTSKVLAFYEIMGVSSLAQIVAKIVFLQLLINMSLVFLILLQKTPLVEDNIVATIELSSTLFMYVILLIGYRKYRLLLTILGITLVPISCFVLLVDILPSLLLFNSNCIILLLILISESYED